MATLSARSRADARDTLRAAYTCAVEDEILSRNPISLIRLPAPRTRKRRWWTVDDARKFLESTRSAGEPLYAAFVLILALGPRKGEVLGLTWELADLDAAELYVGEQVQRVGRELIRRQVETETSEAPLPLPELCVAALKFRQEQQEADRDRADGAWIDTGLVFTTRHGTAMEPRNFSRSFDRCIVKAQVPGSLCMAPEDLRLAARRSGCTSAGGDADPSAQQDRGHDGDLHRGALGRHPRCAQEARAVAAQLDRCCTFLLYGHQKRPVTWSQLAGELGGRYWDRTSDLLGVNEALSR
jgi:integrase